MGQARLAEHFAEDRHRVGPENFDHEVNLSLVLAKTQLHLEDVGGQLAEKVETVIVLFMHTYERQHVMQMDADFVGTERVGKAAKETDIGFHEKSQRLM